MTRTYTTVDGLLRAGPHALHPGIIVEVDAGRTGRVVQMPGGWQLRDHENISVVWTQPMMSAVGFLTEVKNFLMVSKKGAQAELHARINSTLPHSEAATPGDMKMAQKDIDESTAALKAAKRHGAYNGPGIAPNRNVPPSSVPPKTAKTAKGNVTAPKPAAPKPAATKPAAPEKAKRRTVASAFQDLILEGKLSDDEIFAAVAGEFGLDAKKRSYVAWYRNHLKKLGKI